MEDLKMMMMNMMAMYMPRFARHMMEQQGNFDGSIITKEQHEKGSSIQTTNLDLLNLELRKESR